MNYIGRKDDGKYISSGTKSDIAFDSDLLIDIAYNEDIAKEASQLKVKYRDLYIKYYKYGKENAIQQSNDRGNSEE